MNLFFANSIILAGLLFCSKSFSNAAITKEDVERTFSHVYTNKVWSTGESRSGNGSTIAIAQVVRQEIPHIIKMLNIQSMLDLPCVDLIVCRDCLVHLSTQQVIQALRNLKRSGSKYILMTI